MEEYAVELRQITKRFGTVTASDNIDLKVRRGSVHALLGENGSGKSSLMKILFGLYQKDEGQIFINGKEEEIQSPLQALEKGIGMIQQEFMLLPNLSVRENLIAAVWSKHPHEKQKNLLHSESGILTRLKLQNLLDKPVRELAMGERQKVEIAKTLYQGAEIIILDEPTSVLTPQESLELFEILKALHKEGKTIILITHKLDEVLNYCDEVTVLRSGKKVDSFYTDQVNRYELAQKMVGKKVLFQLNEKVPVKEEVKVKIEHLDYRNKKGVLKLQDINLEIKTGEILGIAGIDGNGQKELADVLAGIQKPTRGVYSLKQEKIQKYTPKAMMEKGVAFVPEDRNNLGAVNAISIEKNLILKEFYQKQYQKHGMFNQKVITEHAKKLIDSYNIKVGSEKDAAGTLSGGNLQKVIVARELSQNPEFLIASQPTRGLDIGAVESVQNLLIDARNKGISILLISTELDEVLSLSDRIAVIYDGKIVDVLKNDEKLDIGSLGLMMAGGKSANQYMAGGAAI